MRPNVREGNLTLAAGNCRRPADECSASRARRRSRRHAGIPLLHSEGEGQIDLEGIEVTAR